MAVLDQIQQMKNQGIPDSEIIRNLQEQGISPKAISDALSQVQIKNAVGGENVGVSQEQTLPPAAQPYPPQQESYPQQTPEQYAQENQGEYYPEEGYSEQQSTGGVGTEVIIEVAEQVFEEKIKKIDNQLEEFKEFSTISGAKLSGIDERLKKMENIIDNLQIKILEKVGSYGQGIESIKKEMSMMQNSFSKTLPSLVEKKIAKKKIAKKKISKK